VATYSLTTSPTTIDDGSSSSVLVTNTGAVDVTLSRGPRLRPQQNATVYPEGTALTAVTTSGTGSVATTATAAAAATVTGKTPAQVAADIAFTATYAQVVGLPASNGTDDTAALNALLATASGKRVRGLHGQNYQISSPLLLPSGGNVELDMTGCTVTLKPGSNCNLLNNAAVTAVRSVADAAITNGSPTLTSATASFTSADIGRSVTVAGAGLGGVVLTARVSAVGGSTSATLDTNASTTVSGAALSLFNRDANIRIVGGTWARGNNDGTFNTRHNLMFRRVDLITVRDLQVTSSNGKFAIGLGDCTRIRVSDCDFATASDGVHIAGPASSIVVRNLTGTTGDDVVGMTPNDFTGYNDTAGDITDVVVENLEVTTAAACVIVPAGPYNMARVRLRNIGGVSTNTVARGAVAVGSTAAMSSGTVDDVSIDRITTRVPSNGTVLRIDGGVQVSNLRARGLYRNDTAASRETIWFYVGSGGTATHGPISISDVNIPATNNIAIIAIDASTTVSNLIWTDSVIAGASNGLLLNGTVTDCDIRGVKFTGNGYLVKLNSATSTITRLSLSGIHLLNSNAGGLINAATSTMSLPSVNVSTSALNGASWIADLNTTTQLNLSSVDHVSTNGLLFARANAVVTLTGASNSLSKGGNGISINAGGKVAVQALDIPPSTSAGGFPTIAAGAGAGTGPTVTVAGSDRAGTITVTPGTSPAAGAQATVTFIGTWAQAPKLALTPTNAAAQAAGAYLSAKSTTAFTVSAANTPGGSMTFDYVVAA
jgi:hypothetical protein